VTIIAGTAIVGLLGIFMAVVSLGIVPWETLAKSHAPLSVVADRVLGNFGMKAVNIGIFVSLIGAAASGIITMPRLILALARDKLFIAQFSEVHERFKTPHKAIIFQTLVSLIIFGMAFGRYKILLSLVLPLGLIMYFFVILSVPILRSKEPNVWRGFRVPFTKIGSFLTMAFIAVLMFVWLYSDAGALQATVLILSLILIAVPSTTILMPS